MKTKIKIIALILTAFMLITLAACQTAEKTDLSKDREGNAITLPDKIDKVISIGPSNTEILVALGAGDKIIGIDEYSSDVSGIKSGLPMFSMYAPDGEQIIDLQPDVVFITGMTKAASGDPLKVVEDAGICVIYIPSSTNIDGIIEDIRFVAAVMGEESKGKTIISDMEKEIDAIKKIGEKITDKKTVYFDLGDMYSLGGNNFINEMIELIGAVNVYGEQDSWILASDEFVLDANPDVILTTANYLDDPIGAIKARPGWEVITAVQNDAIYVIDANSSNRPNHNIIKAFKEMAKAIYPDKY